MKRLWPVLLLTLAAHCEKKPEPVPPTPVPPTSTAEPVPTIPPVEPEPSASKASCSTACENQRKLGCVLGQPTAAGSPCEEVCANSVQSGLVGLGWDVEALTKTTQCEE